ncbi:MAG TPA: sugar transferase [Ktedonobacterales bacterium]|nr:sugar transferase [Ktedonobacterales bacterium]
MIKRACDVVVAALGLLLASPPIAAIALALTIEGRGPIFYRSPRLGKGGRVFHLVRFRTMVDAPPDLGPEARPTPVGRFIRNYALDDLPSLVHVLRGDLSLVGPRPMEVGRVDPTAATWRRILSVRPGFVSYAILMLGAHDNTSSPAEKEWLELDYVSRQSLRFDLYVLAATLRALLTSRGNIKARGKPTV